MSDVISRSWFVVFCNPEEHGYLGTPEEIIEKLKNEWIENHPLRKGWWAYAISAKGLRHVHMVLEDSCACRFSKLKKIYPSANLQVTKGTRKQVMSYIKKEPPYDEKGEKVIAFTTYGNIEGYKRYAVSTMNETFAMIEVLIEEGMTPNQIMAEDIRFRREETLIRKCYFAKRSRETPPLREVKVFWHCGESATGKSYTYVLLSEKYGEDQIYLCNDYSNKATAAFDLYAGERILFLDEIKQNSFPFGMLLSILTGYKFQVHCRYSNGISLWDTVHVTRIFSPEALYDGLVSKENHQKDTIQQLLRRITTYVYHHKTVEGYKTYELSGDKYINLENLKKQAINFEREGLSNANTQEYML